MRSIHLTAALAATLITALLLGGCKDTAPGSGPSLGSAAVSRYVAVGNSLTAGFESNALYQSAQKNSFPALIAGQIQVAGAALGSFEMPLYSDPGTPDPATGKASRLELLSMAGPVIGPAGLAPGAPINTALTRPYDNLGVPGAVIMDFVDTNAARSPYPRSNIMFGLVLRNPALGNSILAQTRALNPDLVTFWLGNNDALGFATSGGVSPAAPTPSAAFNMFYGQALGALRAALPNAKIVVANLISIKAIPFFTTVGPRMAAGIPAGVYLRYQKHGTAGFSMDSTRFAETLPPLVTLTGQSYAALLGRPGGKWYRDRNYPALPAGIDTTKPFGFHPQNPWPDALILDAGEQQTLNQAIADFNTTIAAVARTNNAALVDMNAVFEDIRKNGYPVGRGVSTLKPDFVSGGLFSLDGVHPTGRGQGVIANEFIKVMNATFGMNIPLVDLAILPAVPVVLSRGDAAPEVSPDLARNMEWLFGGRSY